MKLLALVVLLTLGQVGLCQEQPKDPYGEKLVASFVTPADTPVIYSMQEKAVNRLGDRAALGLARHMGARLPGSPQELERILGVVRMAFAAPEIITSDGDREPKATLMLLSYLRLLPSSASTKAQVEDTQAYVLRQVAGYKAKEAAEKK